MLMGTTPCERCGHRPVKSFTQRLGETLLTCMVVGAIVLVLYLSAGAAQ